MKYKTVIYPTPDDYDADDVRWETEDCKASEAKGFGYKSKKTGMIHIRHCPMCENENYMSQTICVKCGFEPNPKEIK